MSTPAWLLWLTATLLPLGALWALWHLLLRPERGYGYNRALLLLAPALAAALPLLPRPALPVLPAWLAGAEAGAAPAVGPLLATAEPAVSLAPAGAWPGWPWLLGLYLAGVAVGLARLAWQVGRLRHLAARWPRFEQPGYALVHTGGRLPTSSFGRVVFWDETAALTPAEARAVLAHELAHVGQHHTRDMLWLRLWQAVLWPNPFGHLLLPALRLTHELLADREAAAEQGPAYAPVLAALAARRLVGPGPVALLHPFTFSFTLTRLAMLKNSAPVRRWKQYLVLPLLAAACCVVGRSASAQVGRPQTETRPTKEFLRERWNLMERKRRLAIYQDSLRGPLAPGTVRQVQITNMEGPGEPKVAVVRVPVSADQQQRAQAARKLGVYTYVEQMPALPGGGGQRGIVEAIQKNLTYPAGGTAQGKVFAKFLVRADGVVSDVAIVKGLGDAYDQAVVQAINRLPRFVPGKQDGRAVAVSFTVPITFAGKP